MNYTKGLGKTGTFKNSMKNTHTAIQIDERITLYMKNLTPQETIEHYRNDLATYYQDVQDNVVYDGQFDPESALKRVLKWCRNDGIKVTDLDKVDAAELLHDDFKEWKNS